MAQYEIYCTVCLGMSHSGGISADGEGTVELTDEEVAALVALMKEQGTSDVEKLDLKDALPETYEKLDQAYGELAFETEKDHWLWEGYDNGYYEYDTDALMSHCECNCGFSFEYDDEDYLDEDGELDEKAVEEAKLEAFQEWLDDYLFGLDMVECHAFLEEHMNVELDYDGIGCDYEIKIPQSIVDMAF